MINNLKVKLKDKIFNKQNKYYLFDYDGTLIKHDDDYKNMYVDKNVVTTLKKINAIPNVNVGIVTGRSLEDIKKMVPIENMSYVTNHGYLIEKNGEVIKEHRDFNTSDYINKYKEIIKELNAYKGVTLKVKESCAFIRFKTLPEVKKSEFKEKALKLIEQKFRNEEVRIRPAHNVIEFLPVELTDKGEGIKAITNDNKPFIFFAGDDIADEDGFKYVNNVDGMTARIINNPDKKLETSAQFTLKSVDDIEELLKFILNEENRNLRIKNSSC